MSGLDLKAVHEALANQISAGIANVGSFTVQAFPSTSPRPCIEVWPDSEYVNYHVTSGPAGLSDVSLVIRVYLSAANAESEWLIACRMISAGTGHGSSIYDAVMADRTLGGAVADIDTATARWNAQEGTIDIPAAIQLNKIGAEV